MTYTISNGLRDREYAKFTSEQIGSFTGINVSNILKTYDFGALTSSTGTASGLFASFTSRELNGMLKAIYVKENNFEATGSLFLTSSGLGFNTWYFVSGTNNSNVAVSGGMLPKAHARTNTGNVTLSGTNSTGVWDEIPLYGDFILTGSGMGSGKSGLGVILVYQ